MKLKLVIVFILFSLKSLGQQQFDVFFDFNKDFPNQKSILQINEWIAKKKNVEIVKMLGYCDSVDTKDYNSRLALKRIEGVKNLLEKSGLKINPNFEAISFGKEFKQSKVQAENRKVTIFFIEIVTESELTKAIKNGKVGEIIKLPNIYFYNNSARIVPKSEPTMFELLCALEENPKLKIEVQGHICCQKQFDYNNVSMARARAIYMFLLRNKIDRKRMSYKGYGTSRPVHAIPEKNEKEEDENRRVEILIEEN